MNQKTDNAKRAEEHLLGSLLRWPQALDEAAPLIQAEYFTSHDRMTIWTAMVEMWNLAKPIDLTTLADYLFKGGKIEDVKYVYLMDLWDLVHHGAQWRAYANAVKDNHLLRTISGAGQWLHQQAESPVMPAIELLERAERLIYKLAEVGAAGETISLADALSEAVSRIDVARRGEGGAVAETGIGDLDDLLAGLRPSDFVVIAARPSVGKTAVALAMARHVAESDRRVLFCSIEQSHVELATRMLVAYSGVDGHAVRVGAVGEREGAAILAARDALSDLPMVIDDSPSQSALRIAANARRIKRKSGLDLVVVDYLQLVEPEDRRAPRHEQVANISRRLKAVARETKVPLLALAQLNRQSEDRAAGEPRLSDLRESGQIEADADVVILLHRPDPQSDRLDLIVAKHRNGPTGRVSVLFDRARMRFLTFASDPFAGVA